MRESTDDLITSAQELEDLATCVRMATVNMCAGHPMYWIRSVEFWVNELKIAALARQILFANAGVDAGDIF